MKITATQNDCKVVDCIINLIKFKKIPRKKRLKFAFDFCKKSKKDTEAFKAFLKYKLIQKNLID